jgi:UDP-N-acetylmuramoyl-L-alanyl-D-glutamate--2,6-diaminopimelate ligase
VKLSDLLRNAGFEGVQLEQTRLEQSIPSDPIITGVTHDSRLVRPGFVFVAIPGVPLPSRPPLDGHDFIPDALRNGAVAVIGSKPLKPGVPYLRVKHPRAALADLASAFWGFPARKLSIVGVTGSKGKSTTTTLIHHLLEHSGMAVARISTVGVRFADHDAVLPGHFTTPESPQVQEMLARFVAAGCSHAVLEVSSHALALERVRSIDYDVGVWTNLEPEHLDFHGTMETYFTEKRKLLERSGFGVLNAEDAHYPMLEMPHWSFGAGGDWQALNTRETAQGLEFDVVAPAGITSVTVPMIGHFNVLNVLAATAAAVKLGISLEQAASALETFPGVPGRMQIIQAAPFRVINDFAHTEASVRAALSTLRSTTPGRLVIVVGAAGERGLERRSGIARACAELADVTVFTEEDHRTEPLESILETMQNAFHQAGGMSSRLEPDRRKAIRWAIQNARSGDTVLLAGKGHERTLERGTNTLPWDETAEARALLKMQSQA